MIMIGIVDDHAVVRAGLRDFFSTEVDFRIAGEASTGREAMDLVRTSEVDVLVMDLSMPGQSGMDVLASIRSRAPNVGILILTGHSEEQYAINLLRQGASGFLNKECEPQEINKAIRLIALGRRYITPSVAELLSKTLDAKKALSPHQQLSEREFQVFLKLSKGLTVNQIGLQLNLSIKTISTYRARVMGKMNLSTNSDLTYYALTNKLID